MVAFATIQGAYSPGLPPVQSPGAALGLILYSLVPFFGKLFLFAWRDRPAVQHLLCWSRGIVQTCFQVQRAFHKTSSSRELPSSIGLMREGARCIPTGSGVSPELRETERVGTKLAWAALQKKWLLLQKSPFASKFPSSMARECG